MGALVETCGNMQTQGNAWEVDLVGLLNVIST